MKQFMRATFNVMYGVGCFRVQPTVVPAGYAKALAAQKAAKENGK